MKANAFRMTTTVPLTLALLMGTLTPFTAAQAEMSGNIGAYSKYVLRGITNNAESDTTAIQGGLDWSHDSGFYLGYWGSSLDYVYSASGGATSGNGFENDFYGGWNGSTGDLSYGLGLVKYYYIDVDDSDLTELYGSLGYGPVSFGFKYLLQDGVWGNKGDTYLTLDYSTELPKGFALGASLGYYVYDDDDNAELCGGASGCGITTEDSAFRHFNVSLSHPIGNTGADMSLTYVVGGKDRTGTDQENTAVLGISYGFDI